MEESKFQNVILENRNKLSISGVDDVGTFNEETVELTTSLGDMIVKGEKIHINKLSTESRELIIEGEISALYYKEAKEEKESFLSKLFK